MTLTDIDFIESLPNCMIYKDSDWKMLKKELSDYIVLKDANNRKVRPIENMYNYLMTSDISPKMATHAIIFTLSSATRREQTINYHNGSQHFNIWGVNIGPSSLARKTTTERKTKNMLRDSGVTIIPGKFTASALFPVLNRGDGDQAFGAMIGSEYSSWLKQFKKEHSDELPELLCQIYDNEEEVVRTTRTHGEETIDNPYVTFYGGTTPFAYKYFDFDYFTQGLGYRPLYCMELKKVDYKKISLGAPNTHSFNKDYAVALLTTMYQSPILNVERGDDQNIPLSYTQYQDYCDEIVQKAEDDPMSIMYSYYGRTPEFVLKIAGLLEMGRAASHGVVSETIGLQDDTIDLAVKIVRMFEQEFRTLVSKVRSTAISEPIRTDRELLQHVLNPIKKYGVVSNPDLLKELYFDRNKLRPLVTTLIEMGKIFVTTTPNEGRGTKSQLFYSKESKLGNLNEYTAQIEWLKQEGDYLRAKEYQGRYDVQMMTNK